MEKIIHHGNNNIRRRVTTCGQSRSWEDDAIEPEKVNCLSCVSILAYPKFETRKTKLWRIRLEELKAVKSGH